MRTSRRLLARGQRAAPTITWAKTQITLLEICGHCAGREYSSSRALPASGKDSIIEQLRQRYPEAHYAVTATTRNRRPGEMDGVHYHFMSDEEFRDRLAEGDFLESASVYGNLYGVPRSAAREALARGQDVFFKVDVQGAAEIRR
jgi:guanylate kinase